MLHKKILVAAIATVSLAVACSENLTPATGRTPYEGSQVEPLTCVPNLDGKIDSNELAPSIGIGVNLLVSPAGKEQPVDLVAKPFEDGKVRWDYSLDRADDQAAVIQASPIKGKWYEASFPENSFVTPFDVGGRVEAVYQHDTNALSLVGLASKEQNPPEGQTLYLYTTPIALYRFPLAPGVAYTSVGEAKNGMLRGLPYAGKDTYEVKVDGAGQLDLPDVIFQQALKVRTKVRLEPVAGAPTTQIQVSFLFECFGEVARFTSKTGETADDFTVATEVRRFGLP